MDQGLAGRGPGTPECLDDGFYHRPHPSSSPSLPPHSQTLPHLPNSLPHSRSEAVVPGPSLLCRRAEDAEDEVQLVELILSREDGLSHLGKRERDVSKTLSLSPLSTRDCFQSLPHVSPQLSPTSSSAKIHPTLHMSTSGPYLSLPRRSSGGLRGRGEGV